MKGKIMTTENATTEAVKTPVQMAEELVTRNTTSVIVEVLVENYTTIERQKQQLLHREKDVANFRARWASMSDTIEEFLKDHISENKGANLTELKELAAELDIELTKEIEVTFDIEVTTTLTVPIDFDTDKITESDFNINVDFTNTFDNVEEDGVEWETSNFSSEDK